MSNGSRAMSCLLFVSVLAMSLIGVSEGTAFAASCANRVEATSQSYPWKGTHSACEVQLPEPKGIVSYKQYNTCPPKRVLLVGDSVALTMGIQMTLDPQNWGTVIDNKAALGCGFVQGYERNFSGTKFAPPTDACNQDVANLGRG